MAHSIRENLRDQLLRLEKVSKSVLEYEALLHELSSHATTILLT